MRARRVQLPLSDHLHVSFLGVNRASLVMDSSFWSSLQQMGSFAPVKPYSLRSFFHASARPILRAWVATDGDSQRREWFRCSSVGPVVPLLHH